MTQVGIGTMFYIKKYIHILSTRPLRMKKGIFSCLFAENETVFDILFYFFHSTWKCILK